MQKLHAASSQRTDLLAATFLQRTHGCHVNPDILQLHASEHQAFRETYPVLESSSLARTLVAVHSICFGYTLVTRGLQHATCALQVPDCC